MKLMKTALIAAACLAFALGCDDHDDDGHGHATDAGHGHDISVALNDIQIGCQHFEFGPNESVTASADPTMAPSTEKHHRFNVTLAGGAGFVAYAPDAAGVSLLMLDRDVPLTVLDAAGAQVAPKMVEKPVADCAASAVVYHMDLTAQRYTLAFGPEAGELVSLVIHVPAAGHEHDSDAGHEHGGDAGHHEGDAGHHEGDAGHEHETDAAHEHEGDAGHHNIGDAGAADPAAAAYCECLLFNCHDPFHAQWGADDGEAIANCLAAAAELPRLGEPATEGNSLECRQHFCTQAETAGGDGGGNCPQALGQAVCL